MTSAVTPLLLSIDEAAQSLGGISARTMRGLLYSGTIPATRIGRRVLVSTRALEQYIEAREAQQ